MDPITDVFQTMRVAGVVHVREEATAPWVLCVRLMSGKRQYLIRLRPRIRRRSSRTSVWFRVAIAG